MQHNAKNVTHSDTGDVHAEFQVVFPDMAVEWLEDRNLMNRKPRRDAARNYLEAMENGEWESLNGDTIVFDEDGYLVDGQHRLGAIVASGLAQECLIVWGVRPQTRITMDDGVKRRFYDDLTMNGITDVKYKDVLLRRIVAWDRNGGLGENRNVRLSRKTLANKWPQYKEEIEASAQESKRWFKRWPGNEMGRIFIYWLLKYRVGADEKVVNRFMSIVSIGSQDPADEVLIRLRDKLAEPMHVRSDGSKRFAPMEQDVWWLIRGWNAWLTGAKYKYANTKDTYKNPYPAPIRADMALPEGATE